MDKRAYTILWGVGAVGIAFWLNKLAEGAFNPAWHALLVAPIIEETAKLLAVRQARRWSLLVPAVFVAGEIVVQQVTPFGVAAYGPMLPTTMMLYALLGLCALKHFLYYAVVYLLDYRPYSLPLAIGLHSAWNWYVMSPEGADALPLAVVALAAAVFVPLALLKAGEAQWGNGGKID